MAIAMLLSKTKIINLEQNMSPLNFNLSTASFLLDSSEQFPVDFDRAWQWLGYSRKSDCLEFLKNNFVVNRDFAATAAKLHSSKGGRPSTEYYLTVECFKMIGMMAGTEQGKQVRLYFLECEKVAKTKSQPKTPTEALLETVQMLVAQERRLAVVEQRSTQSEHRIANLEQQQQDALDGLLDLPVPEVEPQPLTVRFALNRLVRGYAAANSLLPTGCYRRLHLSKTKIINLEQNMSQLNFNVSTASLLLESSEQFPVDFDRAWQWLGFTRKGNAKTSLLNSGFIEGIDYKISILNNKKLEEWTNPKPEQVIHLTVEAFKMWAMMAGTEQGKQVRLYFLECEKVAKTKSQPKTPTEALLETVQMLVAQERRLAVVEQRSTQSEHRIANLEQQQQDALNGLLDLPVPEVEPQPLTVRFALNRLVRGYAAANSLLPTGCYRRLHLEFRDRYHIDLIARGKNAKPKVSGVEYAEQHWMIEHLYSVAVELFGADKTPSFPSREL
jgi:anti-repressor protein